MGVAAASLGESVVPLDAHGSPTYPAIAWFDERTVPQMRWLVERVGRERLYARSGLSPQPIHSLCKLLWLREHEADAYRRTCLWLSLADYIAYRLCGVAATDYSLASRTLMFDLHQLRWDTDLLADVGIAADRSGATYAKRDSAGFGPARNRSADRPTCHGAGVDRRA